MFWICWQVPPGIKLRRGDGAALPMVTEILTPQPAHVLLHQVGSWELCSQATRNKMLRVPAFTRHVRPSFFTPGQHGDLPIWPPSSQLVFQFCNALCSFVCRRGPPTTRRHDRRNNTETGDLNNMPEARPGTLLSPLLSRSGRQNTAMRIKICPSMRSVCRQAATKSQGGLGGRRSTSPTWMLQLASRLVQGIYTLQLSDLSTVKCVNFGGAGALRFAR